MKQTTNTTDINEGQLVITSLFIQQGLLDKAQKIADDSNTTLSNVINNLLDGALSIYDW